MTTPVSGPFQEAREDSPVGDNSLERWTTAGTVRGPLSRPETDAIVEQKQATVADSTALGLAGLASATFTLSAAFAGWFGLSGVVVAIPVLLIFGGIGQFLAGMWAHRRGDVLTATAFSVLGCFNAAFALLVWLVVVRFLAAAIVGNTVRGMTGIFVLTFALLAAGLGVAALGKNKLLAVIFFVLALAYLCDGLGIWTQPIDWFIAIFSNATIFGAARSGWLLIVGGYLGMVAALLAFYEAIAIVVNSASGRERWPAFGTRTQPPAQRPAEA